MNCCFCPWRQCGHATDQFETLAGLQRAYRRRSGSYSGIAQEALSEAHCKAHLKRKLKRPLLIP
jgi:hypothetical protein